MERVVITGGAGLVGTALVRELIAKGYEVIIFTRRRDKSQQGAVRYVRWQPDAGQLDAGLLRSADHLIHLAGAGLADRRWTPSRKREIADSRIVSGRLLADTLKEDPGRIKTVISASGISWYGPDPLIPNPHPFKETAKPAGDFLGLVCQDWEGSFDPLLGTGIRVVILRTGMVLSHRGGALRALKMPVKFGLATLMGNGRNIMSWIHLDDLVHLYLRAISREQYRGVYNAVAPEPVSNRRLVTTIAGILKGKYYTRLSIPKGLIQLSLGDLGKELLKSTTVSCQKLLTTGFVFRYPDIQSALKQLLKNPAD